jgi:hypothetical protein
MLEAIYEVCAEMVEFGDVATQMAVTMTHGNGHGHLALT